MNVTAEDIIVVIKNADVVGLDTNKLEHEKSFSDQGVDSLDLMAVLLKVEEEYNFRIPDDDADSISTVEELASYVNQRLAAS